ncbi:hypothetical protein PHLCEN_2v10222 [Hermanssonia centrifuga]|uniref:Replication factor A protein 3 n=1 Tax=Hermanssonia centrifuga TaxID=98765 RepID=A0A2R6NNJ4_9APHY|nr:hypothetical protein PHLCEN_2v10222 [Hermanssonia centrifuga]
MSSEYVSPRVNSARLPDFVGRSVRLVGKVIRVDDNSNEMIVQASDSGEVKVKLLNDSSDVTSSYVEIIGTVLDVDTMKMMACIDMGEDLGQNTLIFF